MMKTIIQQLLEHQSAISSLELSKALMQPLSMVEEYLNALNEMHPHLLSLTYNYDKSESWFMVRIGEEGEDVARQLLAQ